MRKTTTMGASLMALVASAWIAAAHAQAPTPPDQPAPDATTAAPADTGMKPPMKKPMHHKMMHHGMDMKKPMTKGDTAVEDLNSQSLDAAKSGKPFTPTGASTMPPKGESKPMHHMMHKKKMTMKKPMAPSTDATPPADAPK